MSQSLKTRKLAAAPANPGCVDFLTYCGSLDGWLACGWIAREWQETGSAPICTLEFMDHSAEAEANICIFPREDVESIGAGFLLFLQGDGAHARRELLDLRLRSKAQSFSLRPAHSLERPPEPDAKARGLALLKAAPLSERRTRLVTLLSRPAYNGQDTLHTAKIPVFLETDAAVLCPPYGLLLRGWFADPFRQVTALRIRCANKMAVLDPAHWIALARRDVIESLTNVHPDVPENCGFMAFVTDIVIAGEQVYYEVELLDGEVGFKRLPALRSPGVRAIKDTLSLFDLRHQDMVRAFDRVAGPAVAALNAFQRAQKVDVRDLVFGPQPARPACSIIVPLYGRIDFMEYQLAFFSRTLGAEHELIYVLDDPPLLRAAENLATSCLARFGRAFRLLALGANIGYGPANNAGLAQARADTICFLNSDVFPKRADWLEFMLATLRGDRSIGIVGARLLYEDETIQHEGCTFERLSEFGDWRFCLHPNKGFAPGTDESVQTVEAVTGACLLIGAELVRELGGFDESYVIGDFEDADLCCKVREKGLRCVVDRRAQLYHLERQSQGGQQSIARLNLTLYNAWRFQTRWAACMPASPGATDGAP
jgi:GT2 family glycosyltransferase